MQYVHQIYIVEKMLISSVNLSVLPLIKSIFFSFALSLSKFFPFTYIFTFRSHLGTLTCIIFCLPSAEFTKLVVRKFRAKKEKEKEKEGYIFAYNPTKSLPAVSCSLKDKNSFVVYNLCKSVLFFRSHNAIYCTLALHTLHLSFVLINYGYLSGLLLCLIKI